jgi:hypothetical protein
VTGRAGARPPRRVAVTSPQTRIALAGRRGPPLRVPRLTSTELERAERIRRVQLRRAVTALLAGAAFLVGLPLLLGALPELDDVRLFDVPVSWLAVAVLPWPVLAGLAWWQLRRAEDAEADGDPAEGPRVPGTSGSEGPA